MLPFICSGDVGPPGPQTLLCLGEKDGVSEADLVDDKKTPICHSLCSFSAWVAFGRLVEAEGVVKGPALQVCRIDGLEGGNLIIQAVDLAHHVEEFTEEA